MHLGIKLVKSESETIACKTSLRCNSLNHTAVSVCDETLLTMLIVVWFMIFKCILNYYAI